MLKPRNAEVGFQIFKPNSCDRPVGNIGGSGAPGGDSGVQDAAGLGMLYTDFDTGTLYQKGSITNDSAADWRVVGADQGANVLGVTTAAVINCVAVDEVRGSEFEIMIEDVDTPANRVFFKMPAIHNGTASADATGTPDYNKGDILCQGADFNYDATVILTGTGAAQQMCLQVESTLTNGVNVTVRRTDLK